MTWSSANAHDITTEPLLTSNKCAQALTKFFNSTTELSIAAEASSHPSGLESLYSQPYVYAGGGLGNIDECTLQVCLAGAAQRDSLTFASVCVPEECNAQDLAAPDFVENIHLSSQSSVNPILATEYYGLHTRIAELNKFLKTGWTCGAYNVPFKFFPFGGIYVMIFLLFISLTIIGTLRKRTRKIHVDRGNENESGIVFNRSFEEEKKENLSDSLYSEVKSRETSLLSDWNIKNNVSKLFIRRESTAFLDGLRVGSIFWIILGHIMAIQSSAGGGYSNPPAFLPPNGLTTTFLGQLLFASRFAVDTFLFISGFLVVHVMCAKIRVREGSDDSFGKRYLMNIPGLLLHRIARILPLYGMSLGFWVEIAPQLGSGPFWYQWQGLLAPCRAFGWTNFLFINNILPLGVPNVETCFYHSWYLALDFQLFIFAPLLVFWYQQYPRGGKLATAALMFLSLFVTLYLAHTRSWSINTFDGAAIARFDVEGYAKPHVRAQTYLAGMLLGMILQGKMRNLRSTAKTRIIMTTALALLIAVTFITVTGAYSRRACNFTEWPELNDCGSTWTASQTFWYAATSRAIWAIGIGLICFLCIQGAGGIINDLLSLPIWTPLSNLSFGAYLLHPIVIFIVQLGDRQKEPFRLTTFGLDFLSISIVSFSLALAFALIIELPCVSLFRRCFRNKASNAGYSQVGTGSLLERRKESVQKYGSIA